jgi:plasmid stabilization system protein ParE
MNYALSLRPRALAEIERARDRYARVDHGEAFLAELQTVIEAIQAMPLRFPIVHSTIHRALLRRYPFAVFFRVRPASAVVVVLAVLPQRGDPAKWPSR